MRVSCVLAVLVVLLQWLAGGPIALAQAPVLRNVPLEPSTRPLAPPPIVVAERVSLPAVVTREAETVTAPAATEVSLAGQILRTKQVDVRPAGDKAIAVLLDTGDGQRQWSISAPHSTGKIHLSMPATRSPFAGQSSRWAIRACWWRQRRVSAAILS